MTADLTVPASGMLAKVADPLAYCTHQAMVKATSLMTGCSLEVAPAVLMVCLSEGMTLMDYTRNYHTIEGKPSKRADAMLADYDARFGHHEVLECSPERSVIRFVPHEGEPSTWTLTIDEAKEAGWPLCKPDKQGNRAWKASWDSSVKRADMLFCRNVSRAVRKIAPQVVAGLYTPEELQDADVVSTVFTTNEPASPTAAEMMAAQQQEQQQEQPQPTVEPATEVVDAAIAEATTEPAASEPAESLGNGFATRAQIERLNQLRDQLVPGTITADEWRGALQRRKVRALHSLQQADAQDLIAKLEAIAPKS